MEKGKFFNGWSLLIILLMLVIISGGIFVFLKIRQSPGIEITVSPERVIEGQIYVNGGVNNPGLYPFYAGDSLEDIIGAAGGVRDGADFNSVEMAIAPSDNGNAQKININRAEAWLLEALPEVGASKAAALIAYREENGPFRDLNELLNVPGFGESVFNRIKYLITIHD